MALFVGCALPGDKWLPVRNQVAKYGLASIELLVKAARSNDNLESIVQKCLLTKGECEILLLMQPFQRAMAVWAWIMRIVQKACEEEKVPGPVQAGIHSKVCAARDAVQIIHTFLWTQLPFGYVHLIAWLVSIQNLVVSIKSGVIISISFSLPEPDLQRCAFELVSGMLMCMLYQAMVTVTYVIHDPFGEDILDFPVQAYTGYVAASVDAIFKAMEDCPGLRVEKLFFAKDESEPDNGRATCATVVTPPAASPAASSAMRDAFKEEVLSILSEISDQKKHEGKQLAMLLESDLELRNGLGSDDNASVRFRSKG